MAESIPALLRRALALVRAHQPAAHAALTTTLDGLTIALTIGDAMALHSDAGALLEVVLPARADIRLAAERPAITALVLGRATLTQSLRSGAIELAGTTAALRRGLLGFEYFVSALLRIDAADELRRELEI